MVNNLRHAVSKQLVHSRLRLGCLMRVPLSHPPESWPLSEPLLPFDLVLQSARGLLEKLIKVASHSKTSRLLFALLRLQQPLVSEQVVCPFSINTELLLLLSGWKHEMEAMDCKTDVWNTFLLFEFASINFYPESQKLNVHKPSVAIH